MLIMLVIWLEDEILHHLKQNTILYGFRVVLAISDINEVFQRTLLFTHFRLVGFNLEIIPGINNSINGAHPKFQESKMASVELKQKREEKREKEVGEGDLKQAK